MRCSGWSSLAISVCSALLLASPATAHVTASPGFLPSGSSESVSFAGPNEREEPMNGFVLIAPDGLAIEHAHAAHGWSESLDGSTATWTGGSLAPDVEATFGMTVKAQAEPGVLELRAEQRYAGGAVVAWPIPITIVPAAESNSQGVVLATVIALIGVLLAVAIAMLARRSRSRPA